MSGAVCQQIEAFRFAVFCMHVYVPIPLCVCVCVCVCRCLSRTTKEGESVQCWSTSDYMALP